MNKNLKRVFLLMAVIVTAMICFAFSASAETEGYYTYSVSNGEATITDVNASISGDVTIPSTLGGYSVTKISPYAFRDCTGLTSIIIGDSVTSIGYFAFSDCTGLTSITIPDSVTSIGDYAFRYCTGLTSITIPDSVTSIGYNAFDGCTSLTSITIPDSVTSIGDYAFDGCIGLTSITIPDSVTSIGDYAFDGCTGLTSITIPDSVTSMGAGAFHGCTSLESLSLPFVGASLDCTSNTDLGYIFSDVPESLKEVIITEPCKNIGDYAFRDCTGLTSITIPDSVTFIGSYAFNNTGYYNNAINWNNKVLYIGNHLIKALSSITSHNIRQGTKSIASDAFDGCTGLTSITIPDSVTSIGEGAFKGCTGLTSITIPDSVTSIGKSAFNGCASLTSITLPFVGASQGGTRNTHLGYIFGASYYSNNSEYVPASLKEVIITAPCKSIGASAFRDCTSLTSITIPDSVLSIASGIFKYSNNLKDIYYSGTHRQWNDLLGSETLSKLTVHYSPECIDADDDKFCDKCLVYLEQVSGKGECGDNVKYIAYKDGMVIVYGSGNVGYFADNPNSISVLADISVVKNVIIEDGITGISNNAFLPTPMNAGGSIPVSVTIPKSVISIGEQALTPIIVYYQGSKDDWAKTNCKSYKEVHFSGCKGDFVLASTKDSTCTKNGTKTYTCPCSVIHTETVKTLPHKYSSSYTVDKQPTCTVKGSKSKHCTRSGCTSKTNVKTISALGHSYGSYATTKKASLSANGTKTATCSRCSGKATATIYYPKTFKLSYKTTAYSGKAKTPAVTVKDSKGNTLKNGTDYTVSYSSNKAIGTAKAKVRFMGVYSGSKSLSFKIILGATDKINATQTATSIKLSWNKVVGAKGYKVYIYDKKGELQLAKTTTKTSIAVNDLSKGKDYKITVKAYTTISKKRVWSEKTKSITTATLPGVPTLKVATGSKKASLSWTKQSGANGYVVYMATSKKGDYGKIGTFEGVSNLRMTKSKLKKGKTYYFKVRAYKTVDGKKIYGAWSSVKSVKVK